MKSKSHDSNDKSVPSKQTEWEILLFQWFMFIYIALKNYFSSIESALDFWVTMVTPAQCVLDIFTLDGICV